MRKTDFAPMLADEAPSADTSTDYEKNISSRIVVFWMPNAMEPSGMKQLFWFSALIPYANPPEHAAPRRPTSHVRDGWPSTAMVDSYAK